MSVTDIISRIIEGEIFFLIIILSVFSIVWLFWFFFDRKKIKLDAETRKSE